jgi:hypothetical protein
MPARWSRRLNKTPCLKDPIAMKTEILALLALVTFAPLANASSMYEACGSHDGSIRTSGGHGPFFTEVTVKDWSKNTEEKVRDEDGAWKVEQSGEQIVKEERGGQECRNGMRAPWMRKIYTVDVRITKEDGGLFDENTLGVSRDRKAVEGTLLCEWAVSSIVPCQN